MSNYTLAGIGVTDPYFLGEVPPPPNPPPSHLAPGVLAIMSAGAQLTYTIEVTGDPYDANGNLPQLGNWMPLDATAVGLATSQNFNLIARVRAIRLRVTSWTSGSVNLGIVE